MFKFENRRQNMAQQQSTCKECGWACRSCDDQGLLQLHVEVENLKQQLLERENHIHNMEANFLAEADKFPNGEAAALTEELLTWQDKYSRLYESYKRVQKVNQSLEDKLLRIVDKCETEKNDLLKEVSSLTQRLIDARSKVNRLQSENERYRNDVHLAIHLLQCKPANFVPQKYESLPADLQQKVLSYVCGRRRPSDVGTIPIRLEMRTIKVPVSTSPPSAMLYSVNRSASLKDVGDCEDQDEKKEIVPCELDPLGSEGRPPLDTISAAIMAKVLEEREQERQQTAHCESCTCFSHTAAVAMDSSTQTLLSDTEGNSTVCLNGYAATTRGSQGLVRFVDSVSRCSSTLPQMSAPSCSRLGVRISDNRSTRQESLIDKPIDPIENEKCNMRKDRPVPMKTVLGCRIGEISHGASDNVKNENFLTNENNGEAATIPSISKILQSDLIEDIRNKNEGKVERLNSPHMSSSEAQGCVNENCIIDLEVASDGRSDVPNPSRGRELQLARNYGEVPSRGVGVCSSSKINCTEASNLKIAGRDVKGTAGSEASVPSKSPSSWVRYPSDASKKTTLVVSNETANSPLVRPADGGVARLGFPAGSVRAGPRGGELSPGAGPRLCSMRLQAGTNNILLDNASSYELYTSRHNQDGVEAWGVSASRSGAAVLVHAPRSRAPSLDEPAQSKVALWVHANPSRTGT